MTHTDRSHQFTHSSAKRRESIVYGAVGKGGLYLPSDFSQHTQDDIEVVENTPLIDEQSTGPSLVNDNQNSSLLRRELRELVEQERELLQESHIPLDDLRSDEVVRDAFEEAVQNKQIEVSTPIIELRTLIGSSIPSVVTFLLECSLSTVSVFSVGHIGATELAAVSMGAMTANITGYATIQGIATALDTLCPQAFGAKKYTTVGDYFQKRIALISLVMLPVVFVWVCFGYELISILVPDKETTKLAAQYLLYVSFGIPAYILFECGKRFLQAQAIYNVGAYVLLIAALQTC